MIEFHQVSKMFAGKAAVRDLTLHIEKGSFTVLIGTSGSGNSPRKKFTKRMWDQ